MWKVYWGVLWGDTSGRKEEREGERAGEMEERLMETRYSHYAVATEVSADCAGSSGARINLGIAPN